MEDLNDDIFGLTEDAEIASAIMASFYAVECRKLARQAETPVEQFKLLAAMHDQRAVAAAHLDCWLVGRESLAAVPK